MKGQRLVEREGEARLILVRIEPPLLAAVLANLFLQRDACCLEGFQVTANRLLADTQFLGHLLDGRPIVPRAERLEQDPLPHQRRIVSHQCLYPLKPPGTDSSKIVV